jgi:hypothetical protein
VGASQSPPPPMTSAPPFAVLGACEDALGDSVDLIRRGAEFALPLP